MDNSSPTASKIMIIRHAEKPDDPHVAPFGVDSSGVCDPESLLVQGWQRAGALVDFFAPAPGRSPDCLITTPRFIYASKAIPGSDSDSRRPQETVTPLIDKLGEAVTVNFDFSKGDEKDAVASVLACKGPVLVSWEHKNITEIACHIPLSKKNTTPVPGKWPGDRFDMVWVFDLDQDSGTYVFQSVDQRLLAQDKDIDSAPAFPSGSITLTLDAPQPPTGSPAPDQPPLPKHFRSMTGLKGAGALASGSAQYSPNQLDALVSQVVGQHPLIVVDLRQEAHGFVSLMQPFRGEQEVAVSWFAERDWINVAKGPASIADDEKARLGGAAKSDALTVYEIAGKTPEDGICAANPIAVLPDGSYDTEQSLLKARGIGCLRLPTTDHCRPRDSVVDRFVAFEQSLPDGVWLHFHCRAGDGRTTTFMVMHDIFHNALDLPLEEILTRQGPKPAGIGGIDLRDVKSENSYNHPFLIERREFIHDFYQYARHAKPGGFRLTWSNWVIQRAV